MERTRAKWDDTLFSVPVLRRMCHILSAILLAVVLPVVFEEKSTGRVIVLRFMEAYIVFSVFRFVNALLYAAFHIAAARPAWQNKPIKGLRQTAPGHCAADLHDSDRFDPARQVARHPADGTGRLGGRADADFP